MKFKLSDTVYHHGHGKGTIIGLNGQPKCRYLEEHPKEALEVIAEVSKIGIVPLGVFYDGERYPYIVQYDSGYRDVYSESDLEEAPNG